MSRGSFRVWLGALGTLVGVALAGSAVRAEDAAWAVVKVPEGGFSFEMPGEPKKIVQQFELGTGTADQVTYLLETDDGHTTFVAAYLPLGDVQLDAAKREQVLDNGRDSGLRAMKAKLTFEEKTNVDGHPGRALRYEGNDLYVEQRLLLANGVFYQLTVIMGDESAIKRGDVARFLKSLKLLGPKSPPAKPAPAKPVAPKPAP